MAPKSPGRIVVVDDEQWFVDYVELLLLQRLTGVSIRKLVTENDAWHELYSRDPDLLVIGMSPLGLVMLPALAQRKVQFPILATSGYVREEEVRSLAGSELNVSFIGKPFSAADFNHHLSTHFSYSLGGWLKKRPCRIVIVDDEQGVLDIHRVILNGWFKDTQLLFFHNGADALIDLLKNPPDLLLTDDNMPCMTGKKLCERLLEAHVTYPIIVHSAWDQSESWVNDLSERGLNMWFLPVPFAIDQLRNALNAAGFALGGTEEQARK